MTTPRPQWLEPLKDPRNEAILSAAFDIFVDKGFHGATMSDVAKEARVSKETLYARFDSKEGLLFALLAWGCGKSNNECADVDALIDSDPIAALRTYIATVLTQMTHAESVAVYRVIISESGRTPEIGRTFNEMGRIGALEMRERLYRSLEARGHVLMEDVAEFEDDLFGLVRGNWHHNILTGEIPLPQPDEIAQRAERIAMRLLKAYAAPPAKLRAVNAA